MIPELLVIPDGAGESLMQRANTPALDALAASGLLARVRTTPAGCEPGSETCIPALLGHPPSGPVGRGRVDAAAYGVAVPPGLVPWRADVICDDGSRATEAQAASLGRSIGAVHTKGHRLLLLAAGRPPDAPGLRIWDDGDPPSGPLDLATAIVCAPGAAAGVGRLLGAQVIIPAGATGDVDTDLGSKVRAVAAALAEGWPRIVVHIGGPDEAAHRRQRADAIRAIERIDRELLGPLAALVETRGARLTVCADHGTDPATGTHERAPVFAVRWGVGIEPGDAGVVDSSWLHAEAVTA